MGGEGRENRGTHAEEGGGEGGGGREEGGVGRGEGRGREGGGDQEEMKEMEDR